MRVHTEIIPTGESHSYFSTIICDNGIHASTVIAPCCGMPDGEVYEIYGDEYHVFIDFFAERVIIHDMGSCVMDWRLPHDADKAYRGGCFGEAENFIAYLSEMKKGNTTKRLTPDLTTGFTPCRPPKRLVQAGTGKSSAIYRRTRRNTFAFYGVIPPRFMAECRPDEVYEKVG